MSVLLAKLDIDEKETTQLVCLAQSLEKVIGDENGSSMNDG
ncbi:hypothetical protein [Halostagnicola bangensis]